MKRGQRDVGDNATAAAGAKGSRGKAKSKTNGNHVVAADLAPVPARPSRAERAETDDRLRRIDEVCAAWAAIVAERMEADRQFADLYEQYQHRTSDLRGLFVWDALHAAEAHLSLVNAVIARHLSDDGRGDPRAILADLRWERRKLAAVYSVNAFVAVLNQMSTKKAKWLSMEEFDPRIAVLSLAHQTLGYALEALGLQAEGDLTDLILRASQDQTVWAVEPERDPHRLQAASNAAAAFFRSIDAGSLVTAEEIGALYSTRARGRVA
jgi:hypothetical protein